MVITKLYGGLGNQMFQYATGKSIALQNNTQLLLDISFYGNQNLRQFEIGQYKINASVALDEQIESVIGSNFYFRKLQRKFSFLSFWKNYISEKQFGVYQRISSSKTKTIYLDGYWQSEKYFETIREILVDEFTPIAQLSESCVIYLNNILKTESVSIHIRRGDYVENVHTNSVHGICDLNYYIQAIAYIRERIVNPKFFIFSDDIEWCKANLSFIKNTVFVENTESAIEDLELMRHCNHNIIANSTFSWWGAWLNQNENKIVIAPKKWFLDIDLERQASDLIPKDWVKVF